MTDDSNSGDAGAGLSAGAGDAPSARTGGLFRRTEAQTGAAPSGPARLRVVTAPSPASSLVARPARGHSVTERPPADVWETLRRVEPGRRSAVAARPGADADDLVNRSFDLLRTRLLKQLRANGWNRIAVAAPTGGCGATFSAAHLAQSLSQVPGSRTVLMDLNMRRPGLAQALDIRGEGNMRGFLCGRVPVSGHIVRAGEGLAAGLTQVPDAEASHLLHSEICALAIGDLMDQLNPDTLICDLPPILEYDDLSAFLPHVDGVLLVADGTRTLPGHIAECERRLDGQTRVLGVVLNQARLSGPVPAFA